MPADFRVEGVSRVPLYSSPSQEQKRVAVAAEGSVLRGELETSAGDCWLCIELAEDHPLKTPERDSCWVHAGTSCAPPPIIWTGMKRMCTAGCMLDVQWERPFASRGLVKYEVQMQPDGELLQWDTVWQGQVGEDISGQRVEVTIEWPYNVGSANLLITAAMDDTERLISSTTVVQCHPDHLPNLGREIPANFKEGHAAKQVFSANIDNRAEILYRMERFDAERRWCSYSSLQARCIALRQPPPSIGKLPGPFRKAVVMGLYHTCTSAMALEVQRCFGLPVANRLITNSREKLWKHRVNRAAFLGDDPVLVVLMVKEPCFWLQSLARNFYEIHPVSKDEQGTLQDSPSRSFGDLFGPIEHDKILYPDALSLWLDGVSSYFDEEVYPPSSTIIVRSEDFLFHFDAVMEEIADRWRLGPPEKGEPRQRPMKSGARSREKALSFYGDPANRGLGFTQEQLHMVSEKLDPRIVSLLGYGKDAVEKWAT